jgi:hypothetical protein
MLLCNPKFFEQYSVPTWHHLSMEGGKTVSSVVPALLEEADRLWMQRELLADVSFSSSEGDVASPFDRRRVVLRSPEEESRFSYESSGDESEDSNLSSVSELSDCAAIQRTLDSENSFSSDCSQDVSSVSLGDVKISNPRSVCNLCVRFFHSEYVRARTQKSLEALAVTGEPCMEVADSAPLKECCINYYERWL